MRNFIVVLFVVTLDVLGKVCLSRSIRGGAAHASTSGFPLNLHLLSDPWFALALALLLTSTVIYVSALSWLDLSYLLPMTSLKRVLIALFAWLILDEQIEATRWAGTVFISFGALLVGLSENRDRQSSSRLEPDRPLLETVTIETD